MYFFQVFTERTSIKIPSINDSGLIKLTEKNDDTYDHDIRHAVRFSTAVQPVTSLFLKRSAYYHDERGCSLDAYSHRRRTECYSFKKNMSVRDKGVTAEIYQPEKDYRY